MAQFFKEFTGDTVGTIPSGFTKQVTTAHVLQVSDFLSPKTLEIQASSAGQAHAASWDTPGASLGDVELLTVFQMNTAESGVAPAWLVARMSGSTNSNVSGYLCGLQNAGGTLRFRIAKYTSGSLALVGSAVTYTWAANTWYAQRFRLSSTSLKAKVWTPADPANPTADEPTSGGADGLGYTISTTDSAHSTGFAGIGTANGNSFYRILGAGTAGDVAPASASSGLSVPSAWSFTKASGLRELAGSWSAVSGATGYDIQVERWTGSTWASFYTGSQAGLTFTLNNGTHGVDWSTLYRGRVRATA
jgi:hypothetical protein